MEHGTTPPKFCPECGLSEESYAGMGAVRKIGKEVSDAFPAPLYDAEWLGGGVFVVMRDYALTDGTQVMVSMTDETAILFQDPMGNYVSKATYKASEAEYRENEGTLGVVFLSYDFKLRDVKIEPYIASQFAPESLGQIMIDFIKLNGAGRNAGNTI
jgi:hypothetical protein